MHFAVVLMSGTITIPPDMAPLVVGYARSFPNDLAVLPVVDDLDRWRDMCAQLGCMWDCVEVTEQWEDGYWRLPHREIPIPQFGGA